MRRRTRRASGSLQGKRRTPYRQETGVGTRAENPEMANPRGARRRRAWRHLVSTAALPSVGLGVNRPSMVRIGADQLLGQVEIVGSLTLVIRKDEAVVSLWTRPDQQPVKGGED